jgi:hypothetical protein
MKLTDQEKQQLQDAGFDNAHVEHVEQAKAHASQKGLNWGDLFNKIVANGPQLYQIVKTLVGIFGPTPAQ